MRFSLIRNFSNGPSLGHPSVKSCCMFSKSNCGNCGCPWQTHMYVSYGQRIVKRLHKNATHQELQAQEAKVHDLIESRQALRTELHELEREIDLCNEICHKFCNILARGSNTVSVNRYFERSFIYFEIISLITRSSSPI